MAVQSDTSRIQYAGNNSTVTSYAVPFVFLENSHLQAIARTSAGVESAVALTNHTGAGDVNGGTVRTAVAVPVASTLTIFRVVPATQTTQYQEGGDFPAASHERALDKLTTIAQQLNRKVGSAIRLSEATQLPDLNPPLTNQQHILSSVGGAAPSWQALPSLSIGPVIATGSTTARSVQDRFADVVNVKDFGAIGDGVADDTAALNSFFSACAGKVGDLGSGLTFLFSGQLSIPANVALRGDSILRSNGTTVSGAQVTIAGSFVAECLHVTTAGTETNYDLVSFIGSDYEIGRIVCQSDIERVGTGGINLGYTTSNFRCQYIKTVNLARPVAAGGNVGASHTSDIHFGHIDCTSHIRGVSIYNCRNWSIDSVAITGKDSRATKTPGHNGILIYAVKDFRIGSVWVEDSGEHAFRIGGSDGYGAGSNTERGTIGSFYSRNAGACGFKIGPGMTGCNGVSVGDITVVDCGRQGVATTGTPAGNEEAVRISGADNISIVSISVFKEGSAASCHHGFISNGCTNIAVGCIYVDTPHGNVVRIDKDTDTVTGNYDGLNIASLSANSSSAPIILIKYNDNPRTVGNIFIRNISASGNYSYVLETSEPIIQAGTIYVGGVLNGASANFDLQAGCNVSFHIINDGNVVAGTASTALDEKAQHTIYGSQAFDTSANSVVRGSLLLDAATQSSGLNNYAGSVAFTRAGSGRRGAAIAAKQTGSNAQQVGLSFFTGNPATVASDLVAENLLLHHDGNMFAGSGASTNVVTGSGHLRLRSYTVATLPSAAAANQIIYVSDGTSNKRVAVSDGTNWRFPDGNAVS